jgi:hypothetical protein
MSRKNNSVLYGLQIIRRKKTEGQWGVWVGVMFEE